MNENIFQFRVQGQKRPNIIEIELVLITKSKYSECSSMLLLIRWESAYDCRSENCLDYDNKEYIPLLDRFLLSGVTVNDTVYLRRDDCCKEDENQGTISYSLPTADVHTASGPVIIHGPDLINGYQDDDFFLGVITNVHNKQGTIVLVNDEPGIYYCKLSYNGIELVSSSVNIVTNTPNQNKETSHNHAKEFSNSIATGESSTKLESHKKYPASVSITFSSEMWQTGYTS
ncbi:Hypothetical predicted protein [Paramuricea clavata]|uniref:Uncharacterized protein n=1 Tax=Paramuricea clavata TaxID=317549 RepID=A0A6S7IGD6_PARCT|nr:Hypothetical predicted protein [Paramuricea clavata]